MDFDVYKEKIKERLTRYFDVEENFVYSDERFDLFATSNIRSEKYMASKKLTIYSFENDEYCFMKYFESLDEVRLKELIRTLKSSIDDLVSPHHEHMSSTITGIIAVNKSIESTLVKEIKKFHYQKSFSFGLKGWANLRLILIDLEKARAVPSKRAKDTLKFYRP